MTGPVRGACLVLGALLLASCGGAPPAPTSTPAPVPASATATATATSSAAASAAGTPAATITVPDVSGMNHQDAQNAMQAAGLYNLREVDGKGLGRALLVDRNWVQTGQSPPAGTKVAPDAVITLTAVKYTD
ncbi:PASTA domain-containing protein [Amycolatopsis lurida]